MDNCKKCGSDDLDKFGGTFHNDETSETYSYDYFYCKDCKTEFVLPRNSKDEPHIARNFK